MGCYDCSKCRNWDKLDNLMLAAPCGETSFMDTLSCGITDNHFFIGKMLDTCDRLAKSLCFIQRFPEACIFQQTTNMCKNCKGKDVCKKRVKERKMSIQYAEKFYRCESNVFYRNFGKGYCRIHREASSGSCDCYTRDARATAHFVGSDENGTDIGCMSEYELDLQTLKAEGKISKETKLPKNTKYLYYFCDTTAYLELAFPVTVTDTIRGVFVVGQILLEEKVAEHEQCVQRILSNRNKKIEYNDDMSETPMSPELVISEVILVMIEAVAEIEKLYEQMLVSHIDNYFRKELESVMSVIQSETKQTDIPDSEDTEELEERYEKYMESAKKAVGLLCERGSLSDFLLFYQNKLGIIEDDQQRLEVYKYRNSAAELMVRLNEIRTQCPEEGIYSTNDPLLSGTKLESLAASFSNDYFVCVSGLQGGSRLPLIAIVDFEDTCFSCRRGSHSQT